MGFDRNREEPRPQKYESLLNLISKIFKLSGRKPKVKKEGPYVGYYLTNPGKRTDINID